MAINVGLRITGIYFGSPKSKNGLITVSVPESPTVKDVLDAAVELVAAGKVPGTTLFSYAPLSGGAMGEMSSLTVVYSEPPKKPSPMDAKMTPPQAGLYALKEDLGSPYEEALQYYHYRQTEVDGAAALIQLNIMSDFTPFDGPPQQPILDGDEIVWRRVTIQNAAISSLRTFGKAARAAGQLQAQMS